MLITADENISCLSEAFGHLGEVQALPGRGLRREHLSETEILLVRSVTRVDEALLRSTPVRFVASATIGVDHIDTDFLHRRGIGFANSPGCNADAAAQYVLACALLWARRLGKPLGALRVGIVGCGQVGSRLQRLLVACGAQCLINDPPRQRREGDAGFVALEALHDCDLISLHVPLAREGEDPTWHLFDAARLARLRPGALLINAARGAVVDNQALGRVLAGGELHAILDTWEGEPRLDPNLLERCYLGTPHIAGYSLEGRLRGTEMIYRAVCGYLGVTARWAMQAALPAQGQAMVVPPGDDDAALAAAILAIYDPRADDGELRRALAAKPQDIGGQFDRLRKEYPLRREFSAIALALPGLRPRLVQQFRQMGFRLIDS